MCEAPGSVVTLLCSGIQLYSAERRIADCILADVKRASMCTSAELARLSSSSEATITRLCHKPVSYTHLYFCFPSSHSLSGELHWQWFPLGSGGALSPGIILKMCIRDRFHAL